VEGNSIRATCRLTGAAKNTVVKLLRDLGIACEDAHNRLVRGLRCKRIHCDEIWSFCYAKAKNVPTEHQGEFGYGDVWTWIALDADTKLAVSYNVDRRDAEAAHRLMIDVAERVLNRIQLTTDGFKPYLEAVEEAFGNEVDFAQLVKMYGTDKKHVSTSFVERPNLTMRMSMRRFTRLTNAFSKKVENHMHNVALHFFRYNFVRKHQSLNGQTPAQTAGIADHAWSIEELVGLLH